MEILVLIASLVLAAIFAVAGVTKLLDRTGTRHTLRDFGVPAWLASPLGVLLPLAEMAVAVLLVPVGVAWWGALGALVLLACFGAAIGLNLARGRAPACHCFGQLHSEPIGWTTLARNGVLAAVAGLILWQGGDAAGLSAIAWLGKLSTAAHIGVALSGMALGLCALQGWFVLHILRQNGRLLLRLEQLEARLMPGVPQAQAMPVARAAGLPIGTPAPAFRLPDLEGEIFSLEVLRAAGKPVLLLFSDSHCGSCSVLMPDIGRWQREYDDKMTLSVISQGPVEALRAKNAEYDIRTTLLQKNQEVAKTYKSYGTPSAVVVTPEGTIGSALVSGADAIRALVARTAGLPTMAPGQWLPIMNGHHGHGRNGHGTGVPHRQGVRPQRGQPAPTLRLPDLDGTMVDLTAFRGEAILVLFWNPGCGFCQRMLPELRALEAHPPQGTPRLLIVSTGSVEANRAMGLQSTIVFDNGFTVGRAFGATGTPSAILIDAQGNIASELVIGASAVLALTGVEHVQATPSTLPTR